MRVTLRVVCDTLRAVCGTLEWLRVLLALELRLPDEERLRASASTLSIANTPNAATAVAQVGTVRFMMEGSF